MGGCRLVCLASGFERRLEAFPGGYDLEMDSGTLGVREEEGSEDALNLEKNLYKSIKHR